MSDPLASRPEFARHPAAATIVTRMKTRNDPSTARRLKDLFLDQHVLYVVSGTEDEMTKEFARTGA
jgi:hypothetical protein